MSAESISLGNIEHKADWVRRDATSLARYTQMLASLPAFSTRAEEATETAEIALTEALLAVKLARSEIERKRNLVTEGVSK